MSAFALAHPWMIFWLGIGLLIVIYDGIANICNTWWKIKRTKAEREPQKP